MDARWAIAIALLALTALAPVPAGAQAATATPAPLVLEDGAGDVATQVGGVPAAGGEVAYPAADLLGLTMQETPFSLALSLRVAALPKQNDPGVDGVLYQVFFTHNGREFRAEVQMALRAVNDGAFLLFNYRDTPGGEWSGLWFSDAVVVDAAANSFAVDIPRDMLVDKDGAAPFPGRMLESVRVRSQSLLTDQNASFFVVPFATPQRVTDDMPDAGPYPSLPIEYGLAQTGHARLTSATPFRASNGEATTFVYNVTAHNLGDAEDTFELEATSVPAGYTAVLPVPALAIPAGSSMDVPVLLTMPFGHQHGAVASMVLELRSLSDAGSIGRIEIGVRFLAIPQPAGHHDTVYLHRAASGGADVFSAFGSFGDTYINTAEDDPNDSGEKSYSAGLSNRDEEYIHFWDFDLQPALEMGLHVDPAKIGRLAIPVGTTVPQLAVRVNATLYAADGRQFFFRQDDSVLAYAQTEAADLDAQGERLFEADFTPAPGAGRKPFTPGMNLHLAIEVTTQGPPTLGVASEGLYIGPGGWARLPLQEWHDPVDEVLASLDGPGLSPLGPQERLVNPGEAVLFPVSVTNPLDQSKRVDFEISGPNAAWATLSSDSLEVPAHGVAQATVVVRAPAAALDGDRADLVLQAFPHDEPTQRGLLRLVAEVDTDADQVDDSAIAPAPSKDSPAPGLVPVLAGLALLALARRRRR